MSDADFHRLVSDADHPGFWGGIDRISERVSRWLNPILIKEARQSLKSRQFTITFFLLLIASLFWMTIGVVTSSPDIYHVPTGVYMMGGYYFLLALPMMAMVPLAAYRSLAAELDEGTFEMLAITKLSSLRIVTGKLGSAMLQMMIYFAVLVPCFAFCYLLRGVDIAMIATTILFVFFVSIFLTTLGLLLATIAQNRASQLLTLLILLGVIFFTEVYSATFILAAVLAQEIYWNREVFLFTFLFGSVALSYMVLFVKAAAARIGAVTENRSTPLRRIMFVQQLLWVGSITCGAIWFQEDEMLMFGIMMLGCYWLLMGTLMLGESSHLSPRVRRSLPQTTLGRMLLLWFCPGPGTGFMFSICTGCAGIVALGIVGVSMINAYEPILFAMLIVGYLLTYLSASRLIVLPLSHRLGSTFAVPIAVMCALLIMGVASPAIAMVVATGAPSTSYGVQESTNWMWTIYRCFMDDGVDETVVLIMLVLGGGLLLVNLLLLFREFSYRRIAVPSHVIADNG